MIIIIIIIINGRQAGRQTIWAKCDGIADQKFGTTCDGCPLNINFNIYIYEYIRVYVCVIHLYMMTEDPSYNMYVHIEQSKAIIISGDYQKGLEQTKV